MDGFKEQKTSKEIVQNVAGVGHMQSTKMGTDNFGQKPNSQSMSSNHLLKLNVLIPNLKGLPNPQVPTRNTRADGRAEMKFADVSVFHDAEKSCRVEFGSYCLWSSQHKEAMKDTTVKRLKDQLFIARAYYPSIAKLQGWENLLRELKQDIQEHEGMLSEAISDAELPHFVGKKILKMEQTIAKAKGCDVECSNVERKLRQILDLTEDETHFHRK